jgi:hypothetical protein
MGEFKNICLIDAPASLANAFGALGCEVLQLAGTPGPFLDLGRTLARCERPFVPDLVLQVESLGPRCIVTGMDGLDCPAVLWCIDPHLNGYWHAPYARLFDVTCSTQRSALPVLRGRGAADVRWLPTYGHGSICPDHATRTNDAAFVGRLTADRPARAWMVRLLERSCAGHTLAVTEGLSFRDMMDLYRDTRIVPNESILGEVNFRLFEGASCGCLVLGQELGEEQEALFVPGREMDTCADAVEMEEKLALYLKNPRLTQAMGRAARERVQAEHTPAHRIRRIFDMARNAACRRARGSEAAFWTGLTVAAMWEGRMIGLSAAAVLAMLGDNVPAMVAASPHSACAALRVLAAAGETGPMEIAMDALLAAGLWPDSVEVNLAGSMAGVRLGRFEAARAFWSRHVRNAGVRNPGPPDTPTALLTLWARDLSHRGVVVRAGFPFDPAAHLPGAATECLLAVLAEQPEHLPTLRLLDTMLRPLPGQAQFRVGLLSSLTLHERGDWRATLELALANLRAYRVESGMDELALARRLATEQDQERAFARALAASDRAGLLAARLGG